jgi:hypothetical protein
MIRVGNNPISHDVPPQSARLVSSQANNAAGGPISDQVELSHSPDAAPVDRAGRIEALKAVVSSPDYVPESLPVVRKLVAGALARTG